MKKVDKSFEEIERRFQENEELLHYIQDQSKIKISRERTRKRSEYDLGKDHAIEIDKRSKKNLKALKERLRTRANLPEEDQKLLAAECKSYSEAFKERYGHNPMLTPREAFLYQRLLDRLIYIKHTTSTPVAEKLLSEEHPVLLDQVEAKRRGIQTSTANPYFAGVEHNIFFGMSESIPFFLRSRVNHESGEILDYITFKINLTNILKNAPHLMRGLWTSGHFAHYEAARSDVKMNPVLIGDTEYSWQMELEDPLIDKHYDKKLVFKRNDATIVTQRLIIGDEISTGCELLPFIALGFIERLRYVGGSLREALLNEPDKDELIDNIFESLFRADDFELHIPNKFSLKEAQEQKSLDIITPQDRKRITQTVSDAAAKGDIEKLALLKKKSFPLDGYMYQDSYQYDKSNATDLPLVAAIKSQKKEAITWLIENGACKNAFQNTQDRIQYAFQYDAVYEIYQILSAVIYTANRDMLDILLTYGLDLNNFQRFIDQSNSPVNKDNDPIFLSCVKLIEKPEQFPIFDALFSHFDCAESSQQLKSHLLKAASSELMAHMVKQGDIKLNVVNDFKDAVINGNDKILPYLYEELKKFPGQIKEIDWSLFLGVSLRSEFIRTADFLLEKFDGSEKNIDITRCINEAFYRFQGSPRPKATQWVITHLDIDPFDKQYDGFQSLYDLVIFTRDDESAQCIVEHLQKKKGPISQTQLSRFVDDALSHLMVPFSNYLLKIGAKLPELEKYLSIAVAHNYNPMIDWFFSKQPHILFTDELIETLFVKSTPNMMNKLLSFNQDSDLNHCQDPFDNTTENFKYVIKQLKQNIISIKFLRNFVQRKISIHILPGAYQRLKEKILFKLFEESYKSNSHLMIAWMFSNRLVNAKEVKESLFKYMEANKTRIWLPLSLLESLHQQYVDITGHIKNSNTFVGYVLDSIRCSKRNGSPSHMLTFATHYYPIDVSQEIEKYGPDVFAYSIEKYSSSSANIEWLLNNGYDLNRVITISEKNTICSFSQGEKITPLEIACAFKCTEAVRQFIEFKADPNCFSNENSTPLHRACRNNDDFFAYQGPVEDDLSVIIEILLDAKVNVNVGDESPLSILCASNSVSLKSVNLLLQHGADPNYGNPSAITRALGNINCSVDIFKALIANGADVDACFPIIINKNKCKSVIDYLNYLTNHHFLREEKDVLIKTILKASFIKACSMKDKGKQRDILTWIANQPSEIDYQEFLHQLLQQYLHLLQQSLHQPREKVFQKMPEWVIFLSTGHKNLEDAKPNTGDVDYTRTITQQLQHKGLNAHYLQYINSEEKIYKTVVQGTPEGQQPTLHIMINAPTTGSVFTKEGVRAFKQRYNAKIILSILEFKKHTERYDSVSLINDSLRCVDSADQIIFLDDIDREAALAQTRNSSRHKKIEASMVIPVPPTVPVANKPPAQRGGDIISFGMIRTGKGLAHVLHLAELIKSSSDPSLRDKKVIIAGSVQRHKTRRVGSAYDASLYKILCRLYPGYKREMYSKTPDELLQIYQRLQRDLIKPALPIELYTDVPLEDLPDLFSRCTYAFLPAYRGLTLRNSSICSAIANQFVIYSHASDITPEALKPGGQFSDAFPNYNVSTQYDHYAQTVLDDIKLREQNPELNLKTQSGCQEIMEKVLSFDSVINQHLTAYDIEIPFPEEAQYEEAKHDDNAAAKIQQIPHPDARLDTRQWNVTGNGLFSRRSSKYRDIATNGKSVDLNPSSFGNYSVELT